MLEIKAFVRVNMVDKVALALETAGITNITVIGGVVYALPVSNAIHIRTGRRNEDALLAQEDS